MFSVLNSIPFWLGASILVPVLIHFMGRSRLRKLDFPSLILIRQKLIKATKRQRLKNILLLLCRLLFLACLLAALLNPVLKNRSFLTGNAASIIAVHNGAWAAFTDNAGVSLLTRQMEMAEQIETAASGQSVRMLILPETGRFEIRPASSIPRLGEYSSVIGRIEERLTQAPAEPVHCYLPVFHWAQMDGLAPAMETLCRRHELLNLWLLDYSEYTSGIESLTGSAAGMPGERPVLTFQYEISSLQTGVSGPRKLHAFLQSRLQREIILDAAGSGPIRGTLDFSVEPGRFLYGRVLLNSPDMANPFAVRYFSFQQPGRIQVLHAGSEFASLPSLGRSGHFKTIQHVQGLENDSILHSLSSFQTIFLSNADIRDDRIYPALLSFVRDGGTLILTIGNRSNISKINREILVPAKAGYLRLEGEGKTETERDPEEADRLELNTAIFGDDGEPFKSLLPLSRVRRQFLVKPYSSGEAILSTDLGPLLLTSPCGSGTIFLWTTDLDNLEWTTLGASAFVPAFHQWALSKRHNSSWPAFNTVSDSVFICSTGETEPDKVLVLDPDGRVFSGVRPFYHEIRIGPFDKLGHYRIALPGDTAIIAVSLDYPAGNTDAGSIAREIKKAGKRIHIISPEKALATLHSTHHPLWKVFLWSAAAFLLLEALVAKAMSRGAGIP